MDGISWAKYSLISMIVFGVMGDSINFLGIRISDEKKDNCYIFIEVSPVSSPVAAISNSVQKMAMLCIYHLILSQ